MIDIRPATAADAPALANVARDMNDTPAPDYFARCLTEQTEGGRTLLAAWQGDVMAGYAQIVWRPLYPPFRRLNIPEIQDVNVIPAMRHRGIGAALVRACEDQARSRGCDAIGIGVGLHSRFGAAQRLYVRLGYMPDGAGVCYDDETVRAGDIRSVDDLLTLKLIKDLTC